MIGTEPIAGHLPDIYAGILPAFFQNKIPAESFATCDDCIKVRRIPGKKELRPDSYHPDVKCCGYYPAMPNFLLGAVLASDNPEMDEGKQRIRELIKSKRGVSPAGIQPPAKYSLLFTASGKNFGRSPLLLCPYYNKEKENCTIWKHRHAVCATYFCKSTAAETGKAFWNALKEFLLSTEIDLVCHTLLELGVKDVAGLMKSYSMGPNKINSLTEEELEERSPSESDYKWMWQDRLGEEETFYKQAYALVESLSSQDFDAVTGVRRRVNLLNLETKFKTMVDLPRVLRKNPAVDLKVDGDNYMIRVEGLDSVLPMPTSVMDAFDGKQPWREVQAAMARKYNIELDDTLILSLYHYNILCP